MIYNIILFTKIKPWNSMSDLKAFRDEVKDWLEQLVRQQWGLPCCR